MPHLASAAPRLYSAVRTLGRPPILQSRERTWSPPEYVRGDRDSHQLQAEMKSRRRIWQAQEASIRLPQERLRVEVEGQPTPHCEVKLLASSSLRLQAIYQW